MAFQSVKRKLFLGNFYPRPPDIHNAGVLHQPPVARNVLHLGNERGVNFSEARFAGGGVDGKFFVGHVF